MTDLTQIIDVQISRETTSVARASFSVPLIMTAHTAFPERAREYTSTLSVADDFDTDSNTYKMAQLAFGQELRPTKIVIGRIQVPSVTVVPVVQNSTLYSFTIGTTENAYTISYTSDADATDAEIVAGLEAAFGSAGVTGVDFVSGTTQFTISPSVAGNGWYFVDNQDNLTVTQATASESIADSIAAIQGVNDSWYGLVCEDHSEATILAIAADIEAKKKIYVTSTQDSDVKGTSTIDVGSQLKALGYNRTALIFTDNADTEFPEAAWVGGQLPEQPGSNTWAYKDLTGVSVATLTGTESSNLDNKNVSSFETVGGNRATIGGKLASGEYIDIIITSDWLESRMRENVWFRLVNAKKLPFTAAGVAVIEAEIRRVLAEGIANGAIAENPAPTVTVPNVLNIDVNLRAQRRLESVTFEARLAGAIHFVTIRGTLTV